MKRQIYDAFIIIPLLLLWSIFIKNNNNVTNSYFLNLVINIMSVAQEPFPLFPSVMVF